MVRFIHTADWQLGKPFGRFDDALSGRLLAERQDVVGRIAAAASEHNCAHVVVAGDVWDSVIPPGAALRQPLDLMGEHEGLTWWLMPGNHDRDDANGLWERIEAHAPKNVRTLRVTEPVEMEGGAYLLPAPWRTLRPGEDLTAWMDSAQTPDGAIRIGVAHGGIKAFGTKDDGRPDGEEAAADIIDPARAERARLDYLALGDWHGRLAVNARTHYSGTPEPDRHKSGARGQVLLVEIDAAGAEPRVTDIPTARFDWPVVEARLSLDGLDDALGAVRGALEDGRPARDTLAEIRVEGRTTLAEWAAFEAFIAEATDQCAHLELRGASSVTLAVVPEDLDALDAQGSVRAAAEALSARRDDPELSREDRELASDALRLLFGMAATMDAESAAP